LKHPQYGCKLPLLSGKKLNEFNQARAQAWIVEAYYNPVNFLKEQDVKLLSVTVSIKKTGFNVALFIDYHGENRILKI
ncbi:MAG: hypothetical protein HRU38_26290, partial [Saccharospirillaceae bacterium]|nr:hypothetical protein [Saccharospirillaceae bacterium]